MGPGRRNTTDQRHQAQRKPRCLNQFQSLSPLGRKGRESQFWNRKQTTMGTKCQNFSLINVGVFDVLIMHVWCNYHVGSWSPTYNYALLDFPQTKIRLPMFNNIYYYAGEHHARLFSQKQSQDYEKQKIMKILKTMARPQSDCLRNYTDYTTIPFVTAGTSPGSKQRKLSTLRTDVPLYPCAVAFRPSPVELAHRIHDCATMDNVQLIPNTEFEGGN